MIDYYELRKTYKPPQIKFLLLAESPPKSEDGRFFYNPHQEKFDFLFKSIMEVIFPDFKKGQKGNYLEKFKSCGFYLIDAVDTPINALEQKERNIIIRKNLENKIREIEELISKYTPIILIKKNVFEIFYPELKKEYFNILHDKPIPFPSHGHQPEFKKRFKECLAKCR